MRPASCERLVKVEQQRLLAFCLRTFHPLPQSLSLSLTDINPDRRPADKLLTVSSSVNWTVMLFRGTEQSWAVLFEGQRSFKYLGTQRNLGHVHKSIFSPPLWHFIHIKLGIYATYIWSFGKHSTKWIYSFKWCCLGMGMLVYMTLF